MGRFLVLVIPVAITVYAFIDVLTTPAHTTLRSPKWLWAVAVLLLPVLGAVLWFVLGRPRRTRISRGSGPDDDAEFLQNLNRELKQPRDEDGHPSS